MILRKKKKYVENLFTLNPSYIIVYREGCNCTRGHEITQPSQSRQYGDIQTCIYLVVKPATEAWQFTVYYSKGTPQKPEESV